MTNVKEILNELLTDAKEIQEDNFREYPDRGSIHRIANDFAFSVKGLAGRILDEKDSISNETKEILKELIKEAKEIIADNFREYPDRGSIHEIADVFAFGVEQQVERILDNMREE